jgi:hypothetical protein
MSSKSVVHSWFTKLVAAVAAACLAALGMAGTAAADWPQATISIPDWGWANIHSIASVHSQGLGQIQSGMVTYVACWYDGPWADLNYWTNRYFAVPVPDNMEGQWGFITASAIPKRDQPRVPRCIDKTDPAPPSAPTQTQTTTTNVQTPPAPTFSETPGSVVHTWSDPYNAGGQPGPVLASNSTVQVTCVITNGFRVSDGDTDWYELASNPGIWASSDAFYNTPGQTTGSLLGTPFVDPAVPQC